MIHEPPTTRPPGADVRARTLGLFAVLGAIVCFALSFSILKWPRVPGAVIAWWRLVGSSILWWFVLSFRRHRTGIALPSGDTVRHCLLPGLAFGINISLLFAGVTRTAVAHSEFIASLSPLILMPAGFLFFREHPNWTALRWGVLSLAGIAIVLFFGPEQGEATLGGDVLVVIAVLGFTAYLLLAKRARAYGVGTWDFMAVVMPIALVTATPVAVITAGADMWPLSAKAWVAALTLSVLTGMVAHGLITFAHRSVPIATIATVQVSQPALAVFFAWLFLGETITAAQVPGMILVLIGVGLVSWFTHRRTGTHALTEGPTARPAEGPADGLP